MGRNIAISTDACRDKANNSVVEFTKRYGSPCRFVGDIGLH
ncbi:MAG: hypothetical protein RL240_4245 [Planctomycetota bacterium]|jgi:hypothetical protein